MRRQPARIALVTSLGLAFAGPAWTLPAIGAATSGAEMQGAHVVSWGAVEVAATPELAFQVLTDYAGMANFLPGMLTSAVVARNGNRVVVDQSADEGVFLFRHRVDARLAIDETPPHRLTIRSLSGSFKELTGSYVLTRRRDRTLIEYRSRFLPDFDLPSMVGTYAVQRSLERHLVALAEEMNRRSLEARGGEVQTPRGDGPAVAPLDAAPVTPRGE